MKASETAPKKAEPRAPTLWQRVEYGGFLLLLALFSPMSLRVRSSFARWVGRNLGPRLAYTRRSEANLLARRPDLDAAARADITREMFGNFAATAAEYSALPAFYEAAETYEVRGLEHLEAAKAAADGRMVVVSAHYGNWEAVRAVAQLHGAPLALIYRAFNNPLIERHWNGYIVSVGLRAFHKGRQGARDLMRHVMGEGGAMILVDQRMGGAPMIGFLGEPAETSLAPAQLALRTKTPLLPAYARRTKAGFVVTFEAPIAPSTSEAMMWEVNARIGAWVDDAPGQWFWVHRRWRARGAHRTRKGSAARAADPAA